MSVFIHFLFIRILGVFIGHAINYSSVRFAFRKLDTLRPPEDLRVPLPDHPFTPLQSFSYVQSSHPPSQRLPQPRVMSIRTCVQRRAVHMKIDKGGSYIIGAAAWFEGRKEKKGPKSPRRAKIFARLASDLSLAHTRRKKCIPQGEGGVTLRTCRIVITGLRNVFWIGNLRGSCERADNDFNTYRREWVLIR